LQLWAARAKDLEGNALRAAGLRGGQWRKRTTQQNAHQPKEAGYVSKASRNFARAHQCSPSRTRWNNVPQFFLSGIRVRSLSERGEPARMPALPTPVCMAREAALCGCGGRREEWRQKRDKPRTQMQASAFLLEQSAAIAWAGNPTKGACRKVRIACVRYFNETPGSTQHGRRV
jgi:hypothetical protein